MTTITIHPAADAHTEATDFGLTYNNAVYLDLRTGVLYVDSTHRSETGTPSAVWHGHVNRWSLPALAGDQYDEILKEIRPHAEVLVDAYVSEWDGNNWRGQWRKHSADEAAAAEAAILALTTNEGGEWTDAEADYLELAIGRE